MCVLEERSLEQAGTQMLATVGELIENRYKCAVLSTVQLGS